jgi:hypothetical protein
MKVASRYRYPHGLGDRLRAQRLDLVLEPTCYPAHGRTVDALAEQRLGHAAHVARRRTGDVALSDGGVDLFLTPLVPAQRPRGGTTGSGPTDTNRDLAGRGDDATAIAAVAHGDALVGALVGPGADQAFEFLVQYHLESSLDRQPEAVGEVNFELFLRWDHQLANFAWKGSSRSLHGGSSWVSQLGGSPSFLGGQETGFYTTIGTRPSRNGRGMYPDSNGDTTETAISSPCRITRCYAPAGARGRSSDR